MLLKRVFDQLDDYQQDAVEFAVQVKRAALLFEQGTGKTWITGGIIERLFSPAFVGMVVVPLNNLQSTWMAFFRGRLPQVPVFLDFEEFKVAPPPKLLVVHYEALPKAIRKLSRIRFTFIGYDEAQRLKGRSTRQSRDAAKLRDSAEYKLILSGTPMEREPQDLWAQFRFLAPEVFGTRWKDFEEEYLEPVKIDLSKYHPGSLRFKRMLKIKQIKERKRPFDFSKLPKFLEKVRPFALRVTKEVLDLPPMRYHPVPVALRGLQRRIYDDLESHMIAQVSSSTVTAGLRVTQLGKMQQVCGGYVIDDDGEVHEVGRAKLRALKRIVRSQQKPIVVFCRYLEEVWSIHDELLGLVDRVECLTGRTKRNDRPRIIEEFQSGGIDVLICQIKTGGVGIDLFRSCVAIFYSYPYSFIDFEQAISRVHRRGQENEVHIFLLYAINTVDADIYAAILKKRKVTTHVLSQLKRRTSQCPRRTRKVSSMASPISPSSSASSRHRCESSSGTRASRRPARRTAGTRRKSSRQSPTRFAPA